MSRAKLTGALVTVILMVAAAATAQGFKTYPGSTKYTPPDSEETREAKKATPPGTESAIYISNDSYDKVVAFYKALGQEYTMPGMAKNRKLPNGQELEQTFFIFDGAKDLSTSKSWAKVQRPFIGGLDDKMQPRDVRDVTVINVTQKK